MHEMGGRDGWVEGWKRSVGEATCMRTMCSKQAGRYWGKQPPSAPSPHTSPSRLCSPSRAFSGHGIKWGSPAAKGLNLAIFALHFCFAVFVLALRPHALPWLYIAVAVGAVLETGAAACIVALCFDQGLAAAQQAMLAFEVRTWTGQGGRWV